MKTVGTSQGWDKSDNIFFWFYSGVLLTESQPRHTPHPRVYVHIHTTYPPFVSLFTATHLRKQSEEPNNELRTLWSLLFFEKWNHTDGTSDVLPEDSNLRSHIFVLRFFLFHPLLFIIVSFFYFILYTSSSFLYNNINFYAVSNYLSFNYRLMLHLNYYI